MSKNYNNPRAYKLLAEGYEKIQDKYNAKLALINFYNIKGNMPMAFRVIDDERKPPTVVCEPLTAILIKTADPFCAAMSYSPMQYLT